jgi:uncharacterized protein YkwD
MKAVLLATAAAVSFAFALAAPASGASSRSPWAAYLAPRGACPNANTALGSPVAQTRAMVCLINWTRRHAGLRQLRWSPRLASAADVKARVVVSCGDFSHYPCGTRWPAANTRFGRRWNIFGENLYFGNLWLRSPRAAMLAWLESPEHRAVLFGRSWRNLGVGMLQASSFDGAQAVSLWVLEVAGRH